jgi:hypothetical protein
MVLSAVVSLGLQPLGAPTGDGTVLSKASALLRDPGFLAIAISAALIQGSHAGYYTFASITWQASGLDGLTIAGLWTLGVLAEIILFAVSPRLTLAPATMVILGGLGALLRWTLTAQTLPLPILVVVQLLHGATYGSDAARHNGPAAASRAAACDGAGAGLRHRLHRPGDEQHGGSVRRDLCALRRGRLLRDGRARPCRRDRHMVRPASRRAAAGRCGRSAPERRVGRIDRAFVIAQTAVAIAGEQ